MKNLNEQILRIKNLMSLNEQCGGDLSQCETDLENNGYTVYSPSEREDTCDDNPVISCVKNVITSNGITDFSISSTKSSSQDCFVLAKSAKKEGGLPKYHFTFYSDNQVVLSAKLNSESDNDKILYKGKFDCDSGAEKITINQLKYIGIYEGGSAKFEVNKKIKDASGNPINISSALSASLNIPAGDLKYPDYMTYVFDFNVKTTNVNLNNIIDLLTTT